MVRQSEFDALWNSAIRRMEDRRREFYRMVRMDLENGGCYDCNTALESCYSEIRGICSKYLAIATQLDLQFDLPDLERIRTSLELLLRVAGRVEDPRFDNTREVLRIADVVVFRRD